jgi:hypothetical protein
LPVPVEAVQVKVPVAAQSAEQLSPAPPAAL